MAEAAGVDPLALIYDVMLEHDAQGLLMLPMFNYSDGNHDAIREMLLHPGGVSGLSDGGAHCGMICDASIPTFMLTHWARDRTRGRQAPARVADQEADADTAALYGLGDRGMLDAGKKADLNVIDFDGLTLAHAPPGARPARRRPPPAPGGRRLRATIVSGVVTRRDGVDTGARPGRLVRGAR